MASTSEKKILIVDDEPDVRNFLCACMEDAGFHVDTACDGIEAIEKVRKNPPDLITLDMVMPRKSGIRVMRELRENELWSRIPVIVITAHARDEFGKEDFLELNAFATRMRPRYTMEKPITPEKLVKAACDILGVTLEEEYSNPLDGDREDLKKMIGRSDPETLEKIRALMKNLKA